jgi:hypothetical protein
MAVAVHENLRGVLSIPFKNRHGKIFVDEIEAIIGQRDILVSWGQAGRLE